MSDDVHGLNHAWWQERAALHPTSPMYTPWLAALRRGESALWPLETELAGDVRGKRLLHVPCHIGHDTLSWALLGAQVTGVDFSDVALKQAAALADELGLPATWIEADATALPDTLRDFDVVVSTYGVISWMSDLRAYIRGVAAALAPGGRFILADGHPVLLGIDEADSAGGLLRLRYPIMGGASFQFDNVGTYADPHAALTHSTTLEHAHGVADIVTAMLDAGLVLEHLGEHPWCVWQALPLCVQRADGLWEMPQPWHPHLPMTLSVVARRPTT